MFTSHVPQFSRNFSASTLKALAGKGVFIYSSQASPAYPGDVYFTGTSYKLCHKGTSFIRSFDQIITMAKSSWNPEVDGL